jgi:hypothetical protein
MLIHRLAVGTLLFAVSSFAADPFVGTWKFNAAKSASSTTAPPPKDITITVEPQDDGFLVNYSGTAANGSKIVNKFSGPMPGVAKMIDSPYQGITSKDISPNIRDLTYTIGGKEVVWQHAVVSGDGKTMYLVNRAVSPQGQFSEAIQVFDKQ